MKILRVIQLPFLVYVLVGFSSYLEFTVNVASFCFQTHSRRMSRPFYRLHTLLEKSPAVNLKSDVIAAIMPDIHVLTDCDDETIQEVATFLIDAYWLSTPRLWTDVNVSCDIPAQATILQKEAADYLRTQYGERMGKRLLRTCIIAAEGNTALDSDSSDTSIAGLLCMHELIWDNDNILPDDESEAMLRNAVAAIGPKDRRLYKDATAIDIATKLLPQSNKAVCVFSNLAVSPAFRRQGVGAQICRVAEDVAKEWGYDYLHLKVEAENIAAAQLYQNNLGYMLEQNLPADPAIRLNLRAASFVETTVETLILSKKVQ